MDHGDEMAYLSGAAKGYGTLYFYTNDYIVLNEGRINSMGVTCG